ncbi:unnamed protein product [Owenia fusiformis]|uniref:unspecific monooxygenase n=1 Tax=Owenia fusiformis TaxID=6347 RepID=A0A8S4N0P8_OWEFU|nr:unnamed protein product [Owenia fusiformis]
MTRSVTQGPLQLPIFGSIFQIGSRPHLAFTRMAATYGQVYQVFIGTKPVIIVNGYRAMKEALLGNGKDFASRPMFESLGYLSDGMSMAFGEYSKVWEVQHKVAIAAVQAIMTDKQYRMDDTISTETDKLVQDLIKNGKSEVDPMSHIYESISQITFKLCYGDIGTDAPVKRLLQANHDLTEFQIEGNPIDFMPWTKKLLKNKFNKYTEDCDYMMNVCAKLEYGRMEEHKVNPDATQKTCGALDAIISAYKKLSDEERETDGLTTGHILHITQDFLGAGSHAVAYTLSWCILYMIKYTQIQDKVRDEITRKNGGNIKDCEHLRDFPYTEAVIHEVFRHASSVPLALPHSTTTDTFVHDKKIPKGTIVLANLHSLHNDPDVWETPEEFNPGRFLDDNGNIIRSRINMVKPFGMGKRKCTGEILGRYEVFRVFTRLVQKIKFHQIEGHTYDITPRFGLALKPKDFPARISAISSE